MAERNWKKELMYCLRQPIFPYLCGECNDGVVQHLFMREITRHWRIHQAARLLQYAVI